LVAGGSDGIGEAFARQLAASGLGVVLLARRQEPLQALAEELQARGAAVRTAAVDLTGSDLVERVQQVTHGLDIGLSLPKIPSVRSLRRQPPLVAMVQPADLWNGDNLTRVGSLNGAWFGWVLAERKMRTRLIVIRHVATKDSQQVALVDCDDVIEAFPAQ
jgi:NAD(P)-dependent dehydrogenase (short-subunit alcohol dehydrogenase family)